MSTSNGQGQSPQLWYDLCDYSMFMADIPAPTPTPSTGELVDSFQPLPPLLPPLMPPLMPPITSHFQRTYEPLSPLPLQQPSPLYPPTYLLSPSVIPSYPLPPPSQPYMGLEEMWALYGAQGIPTQMPLAYDLHNPMAVDNMWLREAEIGGARQTLAGADVAGAFPIVCITEVNERDGPSQCPICLEDFKIGDVVSQLPCNHAHCHKCIAEWLKVSSTCPVCRLDLVEESRKISSSYAALPYFYPEYAIINGLYNSEEAGDARDGTGGSQVGAFQSGAASG